MNDPVLVDVRRGPLVESRHRGAVAVVDAEGAAVLTLGDVDTPVFPRSAVKALQALPLLQSGAVERYGLTDAEIALAVSSHAGEPPHAQAAAAMLRKAGRDEGCLACGAHWPMGDIAARALASAGEAPTQLHNNCSGKHAGFVCLACAQGHDPAGYTEAEHPVQREVRAALEDITGASHSPDLAGIDGCSIPTYAIPLPAMAYGFARFGTGHGLAPGAARACARIRSAAAAHPFMVAGTGRFDTRVMDVFGERVFLKTGAEGVYCAALPETGFGIALKCDDGAGRAAEVIMAALIRRFLPLSDDERAFLDDVSAPVLRNWRGIEVGRLAPTGPLAERKGEARSDTARQGAERRA